MKKLHKLLGSSLLGIAALVALVSPASLLLVAVEEIPESLRRNR
jgi:hypothetical protein